MATAGPGKNLQDEVSCSICLDYYEDPVMITKCGHNFCRACITKHRQRSCPECRRDFSWENLTPNRHLANIVEAYKDLNPGPQEEQSPGGVRKTCQDHMKPLSLFCRNDAVLICRTCVRSKAHRSHEVVSPEVAKASCKVKLSKHLENLKKEKNKIVMVKSDGEKPSQELLKEIQAKKQEIVCEFQLLLQFLEEQKERQVNRLDDLERETEQMRNDYAGLFDDEIAYMDDLISEIEKKGDQPADEILENIGSLFNRCEECEEEKFEIPALPNSSDVKERFKQLSPEISSLKSNLVKFRENLWKLEWIEENITFDPETAHPRYIVSEDLKSVSWGKIRQNHPYSPKRFECARCILGREGFTAGKHYWKVDVQDVDNWAVGVARESVERDQELDFTPEEGILAVAYQRGQYKALTSPPTLLELTEDLDVVQVYLDYDAGTVVFYDDEDETRFLSFLPIDFKGERVFPFFRIVDSSVALQLC